MSTATIEPRIEELILGLYENGVVQFGEFTLKSGVKSPFYIDLRRLVSNPKLLLLASECIWDKVKHLTYDNICGVPYGAVGLAGAISVNHNKSLIMKRKVAKAHGTKKMVEGVYNAGDTCLVIEDLVTSGTSVLETNFVLEDHKLRVTDAAVVVDREQGGRENLAKAGYNLHSVVSISQILQVLSVKQLVSATQITQVKEFLISGRVDLDVKEMRRKYVTPTEASKKPKTFTRPLITKLTYEDRKELAQNPASKQLFALMARKKTNLCFSADVTDSKTLLELVDLVGPHICLLKTHIDILQGFSEWVVARLQALARKHHFLIFEDRKFADIGNTVRLQYSAGTHHPSTWADMVNCHITPGPDIIAGLKHVGKPLGRGLLLLAEMSSRDNFYTPDVTEAAVKLAAENTDFVMGFISQGGVSSDPAMLHMTPGVKKAPGIDSMGQQYKTPDVCIARGTDIIIVGRGIYQATDPAAEAAELRELGWNAYLKRIAPVSRM